MGLRACATPVLIGLAFFVGCAKKAAGPSDMARVCGQLSIRLQGWDSRLDDPQLDCPRLQLIGRDANAFTKALHETVMKDGDHGEALSLVTDLEASTTAWAAEVDKCHNLDDFNERQALIKAIADKVRSAITVDRDRVQGRCGGRAGAK